jgi:predicted Ser/Thr protein kinase
MPSKPDVDPGQWRRLSPILDAVLDLPIEQREAFLDQACAGDARLRAAAGRVLAAADRTGSLLDRPPEIPPAIMAVRRSDLPTMSVGSGDTGHEWPPESGSTRFMPGMIVASRYRMVSLLGRGGMGEVYRAYDLRLGSTVALKFLPPGMERGSPQLRRLVRELRAARRIAHPNVCRMWDVDEHEGAAFLTMEFVDGESLADLLKRMGRLPLEKAVDVARQVCAGLRATHEEGILHRDLKPGNVMIDGRGRVRIVDFGIARLAGESQGSEAVLGTPGYMSPEQLRGSDATTRSEIYVLGLLLYQLFTGRRPFEAGTLDELRRLQAEETPPRPRSLVERLDPAIDRVIMQCLARDPERRPSSVGAVAAALPGGDPLDAAIAAGETPSPELVSASGPRGNLSPRIVLVLGATASVLFAAGLATAGSTLLVRIVPFSKSAGALASEARETLVALGYTDREVDSASGVREWTTYIDWLRARDTGPGWWTAIAAPGSLGMYFDYRQSSRYLVPKAEGGSRLSRNPPDVLDPPLGPGDVLMFTDLRGRLRLLETIPAETDFSGREPVEPDWTPLFAAAGLSVSDFSPVPPTRVPATGFDMRAAWSGVLHDAGDIPVRLEAAAWRGRPVFFECVFPFSPHWSARGSERLRSNNNVQSPLWTIWLLICLVSGGLLALRSLRSGKADRRGASRLATVAFLARFVYWVLNGHHVPIFSREMGLLAIALGRSLAAAAVVWTLFVALEPSVRRQWPRGLPGWNRLLAGRILDPLVGRDILIGTVAGLVLMLVWDRIHVLLAHWLSLDSQFGPLPLEVGFFSPSPQILLGGRFVLGGLLSQALEAIYVTLALWVLLVTLGAIARKRSLTAIAFVIFWTALSPTAVEDGYGWIGLMTGLAGAVLMYGILQGFGVLAVTTGVFTYYLCGSFPFTTDPAAPYFGIGLAGMLVLAGLFSYGAFIALDRRPQPAT